jgi:ribose transport system permease protein
LHHQFVDAFGSTATRCPPSAVSVVLQNGFVIMGLPPFWQPVAIGVVLLLAVYIGTIRRRDQSAR